MKRPIHEMTRKIRCLIKQGILATAGITLASFFNTAQAQTTMVNCGTNAAGAIVYMEVYEYDFVTEKPSFPGGEEKMLKFINNTRIYPEQAYRHGIQGRVMCSFVVMSDGSISNVRVLRGVETSLNNEARRVLKKMPVWQPGKVNGKPVPVRIVYPITFRR